jgi:hypothetical protein
VAVNECSGGNSATELCCTNTRLTLDTFAVLHGDSDSMCTPTSIREIPMGATLARNEDTENAHKILIGKP